MEIQDAPALLTPDEAADLFRVHRATLDKWARNGQIPPPIKLGGAVVRYNRDVLIKHLAESATAMPLVARTRKSSRTPKATSRKQRAGKAHPRRN